MKAAFASALLALALKVVLGAAFPKLEIRQGVNGPSLSIPSFPTGPITIPDNFDDCSSYADSVCDITVNTDLDCLCTQAYFDSQYLFYACGTQLIGGDKTTEQFGIDALQKLYARCQRENRASFTTQPGFSTYTPSAERTGSTTSARNSTLTTSAPRTTSTPSSSAVPVTNVPSGGSGDETGSGVVAGGGGGAAVKDSVSVLLLVSMTLLCFWSDLLLWI